MRKSVVMAGLVSLAMSTGFARYAPTNFSGTWELDKSKSELPQQMASVEKVTWAVTQTDKQLTVESQIVAAQPIPAQKYTYNLDGSESTAEIGGRMPGKATLKAKWQADGKILEISRVRNINVQGNDVTITTQEHWELADGGKTLKVQSSTETPRGTQEAKYTFTKK